MLFTLVIKLYTTGDREEARAQNSAPFGTLVCTNSTMADDDDPVHVPPASVHSTRYRPHLDSLMSFVHNRPPGQEYTRSQAYRTSELNAITPLDVLRWMNIKTFGVPDPPLDANPVSARSSSLNFYKKSISFYMPNRLIVWSTTRNEGNPTRSNEINDLLKRVKRKEVRKQGVSPKCRRAITEREFRLLLTVLQAANSEIAVATNPIVLRFGLPALLNFQFHLIARIDDTTQVLLSNLRAHDFYGTNVLKTRLNWSKNVAEERDAPWQIVMGSMDTAFCVFISTALWLEMSFSRGNPNAMLSPFLFAFSDDISIPGGGLKTKDVVQNILGQHVFRRPEFQSIIGEEGADNADVGIGLLGSHSIRKFAATHSRRCGITKDEKDIRGRWKNRARVSDAYDDVELPYPDAKVANKLCIGGPCFYLLANEQANGDNLPGDNDANVNSTVMIKTFLLSNVVPNLRRRMSESCCFILGKALLWYIYSTNNIVPQDFRDRVKRELNEILRAAGDVNVDNPDFNPVRKVPVVVSGDEGSVFIEVIDEEILAMGGNNRIAGGTGIREQLLTLQSGISQLRQDVHDIKLTQGVDRATILNQLTMMNKNIKRIGNQPGRMLASATDRRNENLNLLAGVVVHRADVQEPPIASLSPMPRNLYELWREYTHGIGGRKAAENFSHQEKGRVKHKYHRRNVVWKIISGMVKLGFTAETAIDRIYMIYGAPTSVTNIINGIKRDKKAGTLSPSLRT